MKNIKVVWKKTKIKSKILIMYVVTLILSFCMTFMIVSKVNTVYIDEEISTMGNQNLYTLRENLQLVFENVTQFSDYIYFDYQIQMALRIKNSGVVNAEMQNRISKSLSNIIVAGDYVSGVYIMDRNDNFYSSYKLAPKDIHEEKVKDTKWYQILEEYNGRGFFIHQSEGVVEYWYGNDYITFVREIRDIHTYDPLAVLLVTLDPAVIEKSFSRIQGTYKSQFCIVDGYGKYIVKPAQYEKELQQYLKQEKTEDEKYKICQLDGKSQMVIVQDMEINDWKLVGVFDRNETLWSMAPFYTTVIIIIFAASTFLVFVCSIILTKLIFRPLGRVERHMKQIDNGEFIPMKIDDAENEIIHLQKKFNSMAVSIQKLMIKIKEEEKIIAKNELDILKAQINPHFLYNTLDAISALALMENHEKCFQMTQSLGNFYRNSLNSGMDYISILDEVECIQSYIAILNIRYDDKILVDIEVEEQLYKVKILKLVLQPLIENAVYHGIKEKTEWGRIMVKIFEADDEIVLMVSDDGKGMSEERIEEVLSGRAATGKSGFSLYALKQRVSLHYGIADPIMIHSEPENGTEVTVRLKRKQEEML